MLALGLQVLDRESIRFHLQRATLDAGHSGHADHH